MTELEKQERIHLINDFLKWMAEEFFPKWKPAALTPGLLGLWFEALMPFARDRALLERAAAELRFDMRKYTSPEPAELADKIQFIIRRDRPTRKRNGEGVMGDGPAYPFAEALRQQFGGNSGGMHDYEVLIRYYRHVYITQIRSRADHMEEPERSAWELRERDAIVMQLFNHLCAAGMVGCSEEGFCDVEFAGRAAEILSLDRPQFEHDLRDVMANAPVTKQTGPLHGRSRSVVARVVQSGLFASVPTPDTNSYPVIRRLADAEAQRLRSERESEAIQAKRREEVERIRALPPADRAELRRLAIETLTDPLEREAFTKATDPVENDELRRRMLESLDKLMAEVEVTAAA